MHNNQEPGKPAPGTTTIPNPQIAVLGTEIGPAPPIKRDRRDRSLWESGDNYPGLVFHIPGMAWRVAVCAEGYCWILQQRRAKNHWENRKYFARKERLVDVIKELFGPDAFESVSDQISKLRI